LKSLNHLPPKLAQRLLHTFLRDDLAEEVSGDLEEKFYWTVKNKSPRRAKWNYWYQVMHYIRPFAIRKSKSIHINSYDMWSNYFKVGLRSLFKNKGYSFINIGGLAMGMAIAVLIGLWVYDELTFDQYHQNYDRLVRVMQHQTHEGNTSSQSSVPMPLGDALRTAYGNDFTDLALSSWPNDHILSWRDKKVTQVGTYAEPAFPQMMTLKMIHGNNDGLKDPAAVLLSASAAKALFGNEDAMNKAVRIDNQLDAKVAGVYEDLPHNTFFQELAFIGTWELYLNSEPWIRKNMHRWGNNSFQLFGQLSAEAEMNTVSEKIKMTKYNLDEEQRRFKPEIFLFPMSDWHLRSKWINGIHTGGQIQTVWLFAIIGVFVLLLACINFMNLSTARSEKRAKEVGIRMTIGSVRSQLINQFLSESFLVVVLAFAVALCMVTLSLSWFNELAAKQISIPWTAPYFWMAGIAFVIITSLLAGSYPALYLSSFRPVKVLKGTFKAGRFASLPRKVLVVVQFTVSVTLVIGTVMVDDQIQYSQHRPVGYSRDGLVLIEMNSPDFRGKLEALETELKNAGAIESMAASSSPTNAIWSNNGGFVWEGLDPELQYSDYGTIWVTPEYGKTIGWAITDGRDFSHELATDSLAIVINEAAVKFLGVKNPVGLTAIWDGRIYHVVGVVQDLIMESPYRNVRPNVYFTFDDDLSWINLKLSAARSTQESLAIVENVFKKVIPSVPFNYKFADETYARKFAAEVRIGRLVSVFSVLAIVISCLGIFGLASFVAEQRTKEIGIRKVLGASIGSLWQMLSKDFVVLVIIASVLAVPIAVYFLNDWLKSYEYHTEISWWVPVSSVAGALAITLVTVSYQAIRSARMNPVRSLRSE